MSTDVHERQPPFSEEAERAVLGAVMMDPERSLHVLRGGMKMHADEFYLPAHRVVLDHAFAMADANRPIDILTLQQRLADHHELAGIGGASFLEALLDATPTSAHLEHYAAIVRQKATVRRIIEAARATVEACQFSTKQPDEILAACMANMQAISDGTIEKSRGNLEVFDAKLAAWERAYETRRIGDEFLPGLKTPFRRYNQIMGGMQPGLHFFGGKSSAGKTSFLINLIREFLMQDRPGLMIQLDDTHEDVLGRLTSMIAGTSLPALEQGFARADSLAKIKNEIRPLMAALKLHVVEECADMRQAMSLAQYHKARHAIEWVMIDYVQVLDADGNPRDDERMRLGKIANYCKRMWKALRIPVLAVSQTSKFKDHEDDGLQADMSDLFGASELFHAATSVAILKSVREKDENKTLMPVTMDYSDDYGATKWHAVAAHVVKNKHGPKGLVRLWALLKYFKFQELPMVKDNGVEKQIDWWEDKRNHGPIVPPPVSNAPAWAR